MDLNGININNLFNVFSTEDDLWANDPTNHEFMYVEKRVYHHMQKLVKLVFYQQFLLGCGGWNGMELDAEIAVELTKRQALCNDAIHELVAATMAAMGCAPYNIEGFTDPEKFGDLIGEVQIFIHDYNCQCAECLQVNVDNIRNENAAVHFDEFLKSVGVEVGYEDTSAPDDEGLYPDIHRDNDDDDDDFDDYDDDDDVPPIEPSPHFDDAAHYRMWRL